MQGGKYKLDVWKNTKPFILIGQKMSIFASFSKSPCQLCTERFRGLPLLSEYFTSWSGIPLTSNPSDLNGPTYFSLSVGTGGSSASQLRNQGDALVVFSITR